MFTSVNKTKCVTVQQPENQTTTSDKLQIDAPQASDTSISAELVRAILNNQPTVVVKCTAIPPVKSPHKTTPQKTFPSDSLNYIISNQPNIVLKRSKEADKLVQQLCKFKTKKKTRIFPTTKTALKFKFRMSKFGIKCKAKRKYAFRYKVVDCTKVSRSVHE